MKRVNDNRDTTNPCGQPPEGSRLGRVSVDDIGFLPADDPNEFNQRQPISKRIQRTPERRDDSRLNTRIGYIELGFTGLDQPRNQRGFIAPFFQFGGEVDGLARGATDIQAGYDSKDPYGAASSSSATFVRK